MLLDRRRNFRIAFALELFNAILPPVIIVFSAAQFLQNSLLGNKLVLFLFTAPLFWTAKIKYKVYAKKRDAARLGARLAPEVKGRWPGNIDILLRIFKDSRTGYVGLVHERLMKELNSDTINLRILWNDHIVTCDPRAVQTVLATGFNLFHKGDDALLRLFGLFGDGIFTSDGEAWKKHRALTKPFFARERVRDFDLFGRYADKLIDIYRSKASLGEAVDVQDLFGRLTLDAAGEFLFGTTEMNTLDAPLPRAGSIKLGPKGSAPPEGTYGGFLRAFEEIQFVITDRGRSPSFVWPIFELWTDRTAEHNRVIDAWLNPLIEKALREKDKRIAASQTLGDDEGCLTDHLALVTDDKKVIRDELMNILLAARDTTAALLTFMVYCLALHPDVAKKLRSEILDICPSGSPTYANIREMKYLRACINETLRLFPPVPVDKRSSTQASVFPAKPGEKGIYMPGPETLVTWWKLLVHTREDLWGADAAEFMPERWIDERLQRYTASPFSHIPFNAGPRICLGQQFAYNEASFVMVRLLQSFEGFDVKQRESAPSAAIPPDTWKVRGARNVKEHAAGIWPQTAVTLYAKGGMWVRMKPAATI